MLSRTKQDPPRRTDFLAAFSDGGWVNSAAVCDEKLAVTLTCPSGFNGVGMHTAQSAPHIHDDDLTIYVRGGLESEAVPALESHLLECEICQESLSNCVGIQLRVRCTGKQSRSQSNSEPRSEPRFETKDEAILQQIHPLSFERQRVRVIDVSRNGLGLLTVDPLFPGVIVQVRVGAAVELAEVRHCARRDDDGYRVGLRLQQPS
jgi:hypothetical protein